jgi:hypothetical protein
MFLIAIHALGARVGNMPGRTIRYFFTLAMIVNPAWDM